jgi:hypothetical protein
LSSTLPSPPESWPAGHFTLELNPVSVSGQTVFELAVMHTPGSKKEIEIGSARFAESALVRRVHAAADTSGCHETY